MADLDGQRRSSCRATGAGRRRGSNGRRRLALLAARPGARGRAGAARSRSAPRSDRARERQLAGRAAGPARGAAGLAGAVLEAASRGAAAAGAEPPRRRAAAAGRPLARAGTSGGRAAGNEQADAGSSEARREIAASLDELRDVARGLHPAVVSGHGLDVALEQLVARAPVPCPAATSTSTAGCPRRSRSPPTTSSRRASPTSASTPEVDRATVEVARPAGELVVEVARRRRRWRGYPARLGPARSGRSRRDARRPTSASGAHPAAAPG